MPTRAPGRRRLGEAKAERLHDLAADSIAVPELDAEVAFEVGLLLDQFDLLERQIGTADGARRVAARWRAGPPAPDHPGRRARRPARALIAEIGDIGRFETSTSCSPMPASIPPSAAPGARAPNPETAWHMSKAGNAHLRAAAYRMAVVGTVHNPVIAAHYARKREAGKSKMNALGHCMRKALSIVWGVWRNGTDFDPPGDRGLTRPYGI